MNKLLKYQSLYVMDEEILEFVQWMIEFFKKNYIKHDFPDDKKFLYEHLLIIKFLRKQNYLLYLLLQHN